MSTANSLMIKYGLPHSPLESEVSRWVHETERLIASGYSAEKAGQRAANALFPGTGTRLYKAQADTVIALLAEAKKRK